MSKVVDEMKEILHSGVKYRSGRYKYGSGEIPFQHDPGFTWGTGRDKSAYELVDEIKTLRKSGMSEDEIAKKLGYRTQSEMGKEYRQANRLMKAMDITAAKSLRNQGMGWTEIAKELGVGNESTVRGWFDNPEVEKNTFESYHIADALIEEINKKGMIDVGKGVERNYGISRNTLNDTLDILAKEGYNVYPYSLKNVTDGSKNLNTYVLADKNISWDYMIHNPGEIKMAGDFVEDGKIIRKVQPPASLDSSRVGIRYAEEGGTLKDGVIEIRRGTKDLNLGDAHYAQVRILVDGTHYLKGMAMYSDDLPKGVDVLFNTNKAQGTDKMKVLKKIHDDPDNPFGAYIKANGQSMYIDKDGKEKLSPINKLKEEGDWDTMSRNLSAQFLAKQPLKLIDRQLKQSYADSESEFQEIMSLTNPVLKKKLLWDFAESCDSAAVHMKAASLPGQSTRVILPLNSIGEKEVYAPTYPDGTRVWLVRYPHAGTFEIPELIVNNKNRNARAILGTDIKDAIGINAKTAEQLSGADFDGDQVIVIPESKGVRISARSPLPGLEGFDPKTSYSTEKSVDKNGNTVYINPKTGKTARIMSDDYKQKQMGIVSNLITDMQLRGAEPEELERAVRHSMVVIDAAKHELDYKQSETDNNIHDLKLKYQRHLESDGNYHMGASTLLSKKKQEVNIPETKGSPMVDPKTGKISYKESGAYYERNGKIIYKTSKRPLILETEDVSTLSSGTQQENLYVDYCNKMKAMGNMARKEWKATKGFSKSSTAAETYAEEVASLKSKLNTAAKNAPLERRAHAIANGIIKEKEAADKKNGVDTSTSEWKKQNKKDRQMAIEAARAKVGSGARDENGRKIAQIRFTDREWEAVQSGAIAATTLEQIFKYADKDDLRARATPKTTLQLSPNKQSRINRLKANGLTIAEIADAVGCSPTTVSKYLSDQNNK